MLNQVFATKREMSQGWTTLGRRVAITRCRVDNNIVVAQHRLPQEDFKMFEIGYGRKKLKNVSKPLKTKLEKSGFSKGILGLRGVKNTGDDLKTGDTIRLEQVLSVGDMVKVQGTSKGRGFAGGMKRHGFHGGPKTHGQSDRARAVGSIGAGTSPGRVWKGKKMPGHYGDATATILNLAVLHIDEKNQEVWLSGPIPGSFNSAIKIEKTTGKSKLQLDKKASGVKEEVKVEVPEVVEDKVNGEARESALGQETEQKVEAPKTEAPKETEKK
jgi:large subunit ribosomal protein L3